MKVSEYAMKVLNEIKKYPKVYAHYHDDIGKVIIRVGDYNADPEIQSQVYDLISQSGDYGFGDEHWVFFIQKLGRSEDEDLIVLQLSTVD